MEYHHEELAEATENFSPTRLIGKGSHGSVYLGTLDDGENKLVAIKKSLVTTTNPSGNKENSIKLENEINVLSSLPESSYIIKFLGTSNNKVLVMEYMPNGSLFDLLHLSPTPPSWAKRVEIAIAVAKAVQALHEGTPLVIHRDIKSSNVLCDSDWNSKLADFGLAVMQRSTSSDDDHLANCKPAGTIGYMDPCYTTPGDLSTKVDVYSYGVVLLEIISGRKAIDVTKVSASIVDWASCLVERHRWSEIRDTRIELSCSFMEAKIEQLCYLAARCVSPNQEDRPSIGEVVMGMERSDLVVERVLVPSNWIGATWSALTVRIRRRKLVRTGQEKKYAGENYDAVKSDIAKGKLLFREILADLVLN